MDDLEALQKAVADLQRRMAAVERSEMRPSTNGGEPDGDNFWALNALKARLGEHRGAVLFAGAVELDDGPVEWQLGYPQEGIFADDWGAHAARLASLGNPTRLRLLQAVLSGAQSVAQLTALDGIGTTGQLYHHLNGLAAQGWLETVARGRYAVPPARVIPLLVILAATR